MPIAVLNHPVARRAWIAWGLLLALTCGWDATGWDRRSMHLWGDASGFALQHHPLLETWLHGHLRTLGWAVYVAAWVWALRPHNSSMAKRPDRIALLGVVTLNVLLINVLKLLSLTSCPWSVAEWGGVAQYVSHWQWGVADGGPGRCFPGGHASTAWAFSPLVLAAWWPLQQQRPVARVGWITCALLVGAVLTGVTQTVRGAHYPSHTLWTAVICSGVSLLYWTWRHRRK